MVFSYRSFLGLFTTTSYMPRWANGTMLNSLVSLYLNED